MEGKHSIELSMSIEEIWAYISDINAWASSVPGYVSHEIMNDKQSEWAIKGDMGILKKTANLQVEITEWTEPCVVAFQFKSISGDFSGSGRYEAEAIADNRTRITGFLEIKPEATSGPMATMQNKILKKFVPKTTKEMTDAVAGQIIA